MRPGLRLPLVELDASTAREIAHAATALTERDLAA
jgi:hypothetical protein